MQNEKEIVEKTEPKTPMTREEEPVPVAEMKIRRPSMENMTLLQMTPEKKLKPIVVKMVKVDEVAKLKNDKRTPKILSPISEDAEMEVFFKRLSRYQFHRMDEQRAVLNYAKEDGANGKATSSNEKDTSEEEPVPETGTRIRRPSMENMTLLQMTPEKKLKPIDVKMVKVDEVVKLKNNKRTPKILSPISEDAEMEVFFKRLSRYQFHRMDEQRAVLNYAKEDGAKGKATSSNDKDTSEEEPVPETEIRIRRPSMENMTLLQMTPEKKLKPIDVKKVKVDEVDKLKNNKRTPKILSPISEDAEMEVFFKRLSRYQFHRMDEQRAVLNYAKEDGAKGKATSSNDKDTSPKEQKVSFWSNLKRNKKQIKGKKGGLQRGFKPNTPYTESQDDFLDMIARYQDTRLDDQSTDLPSPKPQEDQAKALADDDCFDQMMHAQCDRMDNQRATMPGEDIDAIKGDSYNKE